jgi:ribonuclease D
MADPAIEKVLHAGDNDIQQLRRDFGYNFVNLFDTLVAAKAIGRKKVGLGSLVEEILGIKLEKDEQRSDWGRRPLSADQIAYAFADTRHLLELADALRREVATHGAEIVEEVAVDCERLTVKEGRAREVDVNAFERHKSARKMDPVSRQILRLLFEAREKKGLELDRALFRIVSDEALGEVAIRKPQSKAELGKIPGVTPPIVSRHGDMLMAAVEEGLRLGPFPFVRRQGPAIDPRIEERYEALRAWRKGRAAARGVEVDVIAGNAALHAIAEAAPKSADALSESGALDPFRLRKYGAEILAALKVGPVAKPVVAQQSLALGEAPK